MNQSTNPPSMTMTEQKDNYIPAWDSLRRYGSTGLTTGGSLLVPSRPASEGDEDVLASIARRHVSSLGIMQAVRRYSPQAVRQGSPQAVRQGSPQADLIPPDAPPTAHEGELPVESEDESPLPDLTGLRETSPRDVFYVRRAICKSQGEPARGEPAGDNLARSRIARVLIVYLVSMAALTVLAVVMCFATRLDGQRNEEFAQTSALVDGGRDSEKTEDPAAEALGRRNTVIVVDK